MFPVKSKSREDKTLFGSSNTAKSRRGNKENGWLLKACAVGGGGGGAVDVSEYGFDYIGSHSPCSKTLALFKGVLMQSANCKTFLSCIAIALEAKARHVPQGSFLSHFDSLASERL
jgi:hypothetical protein